jgi:archaemetzincin
MFCGICGLFMLGVGLLACAACAQGPPQQQEFAFPRRPEGRVPPPFDKLLPLHVPLDKPRPGEWLSRHFEAGQTYEEYVASRPVRPDRHRHKIYVQPLGDFTNSQRKIVDLTTEFLSIYFGLPVQKQEPLSLAIIPAQARRKHPTWGMDQILSTYVLSNVLSPRLPKDACAYLAFTPIDLWPGEGWNFVFGQASLQERVGVWSLYRNGDPDESADSFRLCLLRTLKIASHETGHMFSMHHCIWYECNMCGSNHREEADRRPLALCPHCLAKLCHATGVDPVKRYEKLIAFCKAQDLKAEQARYEKLLSALARE